MAVKEILQGVHNYIIDKQDIDIKAKICSSCEFLNTSIIFKNIREPKYPKIAGKKCSKCGCIISFKIRSNSKCPINKF